ncbi:hypothetical protein [Actinoplanes sp. NPDC020271]|uniref:hypothetical protein n=1 Tax=Actinoplanes sp. NPDC020271 TaxID=3363896 RepID=UPI0037B705F2
MSTRTHIVPNVRRRLRPGPRVAAVVLIVAAVLATVFAGSFHVAPTRAGAAAGPARRAG